MCTHSHVHLFLCVCVCVCVCVWGGRYVEAKIHAYTGVISKLKMVAFRHHVVPKKYPKKWRTEKEKCCCLINFSSKQWAFLCSVPCVQLKRSGWKYAKQYKLINFAIIEESRPDLQLKTMSPKGAYVYMYMIHAYSVYLKCIHIKACDCVYCVWIHVC